ncbi:MAG: hypothetical protein KJ000_18705 [Pirellulaceae bacterium]|nr:hypothetical protein [Pirellulaceae bacterium]
MKNLICFVTAAVLLLVGDTAFAQAPTYAPYGAWRGRIRYVEGPWRTRSTIHWGNGITPVGAQVLIQGLTSAENVLTNPDFLSKLSGLRDAEADKEAEARDADIRTAIEDIHARNVDIRKHLNEKVLERWNLKPTEVEPLVSSLQSPEELNPSTSETAPDLIAEIEKIARDINEQGATLKEKHVIPALDYARFLEQAAVGNLLLSDQQRAWLKTLIDYAQEVGNAFNAQPSAAAHSDPVEAMNSLASLVGDLKKGHQAISQKSADYRRNGKKLGELARGDKDLESVAENAVNEAAEVDKWLDLWKPPQSIPVDAFKDVKLAEAAGAEATPVEATPVEATPVETAPVETVPDSAHE